MDHTTNTPDTTPNHEPWLPHEYTLDHTHASKKKNEKEKRKTVVERVDGLLMWVKHQPRTAGSDQHVIFHPKKKVKNCHAHKHPVTVRCVVHSFILFFCAFFFCVPFFAYPVLCILFCVPLLVSWFVNPYVFTLMYVSFPCVCVLIRILICTSLCVYPYVCVLHCVSL